MGRVSPCFPDRAVLPCENLTIAEPLSTDKRCPRISQHWGGSAFSRKVAESGTKVGRVGAVWGRVGTPLGRHRGDSDPPGATRGADWAHAGPTRSAEWDPHLWRVALAGSDSPLPLAHSAAHSAPRHYRARRHFLCGPFLSACLKLE